MCSTACTCHWVFVLPATAVTSTSRVALSRQATLWNVLNRVISAVSILHLAKWRCVFGDKDLKILVSVDGALTFTSFDDRARAAFSRLYMQCHLVLCPNLFRVKELVQDISKTLDRHPVPAPRFIRRRKDNISALRLPSFEYFLQSYHGIECSSRNIN